MKIKVQRFSMTVPFFICMLFFLSCNNDADLLTDAVLSDRLLNESPIVNDYFVIQPNKSVVLDVLFNDEFPPNSNVRIIELSDPQYGTVEINESGTGIIYSRNTSSEEDQSENDQSEQNTNNQETENTNAEQNEENQDNEESTSENEDSQNTEDEESTENTSNNGADNNTGESTEENESTEEADETSEDADANEEDTSSENNTNSNTNQNDTFTYTTEETNDDGSTTTNQGSVEVEINATGEDNETTNDTTNSSTNEEEEDTPTQNENEGSESANLLFSSGFEGVTLSNEIYDYRYVQGTDSKTGFSWPPEILGSNGNDQSPSGIHIINTNGATITNRLETVTGHNGDQTTALYQAVDRAQGATQTPYQINNIKENPDELYITYWMKIDNTSLSGSRKWRALWEYKTDDYGNGNGFRMIAFIYTDANGRAFWHFQGDRNPSNSVWEKSNYSIPVPRDQWFKVEYYFKWSEGNSGRAFMKVNDQLVGEHNGPTTANSKDLNFIILTQVYGDTSPMHQWVDDIEIWDGIPN